MKIICLMLALMVSLVDAGLLLSGGYHSPQGEWARDRYNGGPAFSLSGEWPLDPHFAVVVPLVGYLELGTDKMLPQFIWDNYGVDVSAYGQLKSNMWYGGGGVKGIFFPESYFTPTLGLGFGYFSRGVTLNGMPFPTIPGVLPEIPTSASAGGSGFILTYGFKVANPFNLSIDVEGRNYWANGVGNTEIDQFMEIPERNAQGFMIVGSVEFF